MLDLPWVAFCVGIMVDSCSEGVTLTESALNRIKAALGEDRGSVMFKVSVHGGGCAGFRYEFSVGVVPDSEDEPEEDDGDCEEDLDFDEDADGDEVGGGSNLVVSDESGKPLLFIDRHSRGFLRDSVIDYVEDMNGSRFVVSNPSVKFGCGCGNSFSL